MWSDMESNQELRRGPSGSGFVSKRRGARRHRRYTWPVIIPPVYAKQAFSAARPNTKVPVHPLSAPAMPIRWYPSLKHFIELGGF